MFVMIPHLNLLLDTSLGCLQVAGIKVKDKEGVEGDQDLTILKMCNSAASSGGIPNQSLPF